MIKNLLEQSWFAVVGPTVASFLLVLLIRLISRRDRQNSQYHELIPGFDLAVSAIIAFFVGIAQTCVALASFAKESENGLNERVFNTVLDCGGFALMLLFGLFGAALIVRAFGWENSVDMYGGRKPTLVGVWVPALFGVFCAGFVASKGDMTKTVAAAYGRKPGFVIDYSGRN